MQHNGHICPGTFPTWLTFAVGGAYSLSDSSFTGKVAHAHNRADFSPLRRTLTVSLTERFVARQFSVLVDAHLLHFISGIHLFPLVSRILKIVSDS